MKRIVNLRHWQLLSNMQSRLLLPKARRTYQILIYGSIRFDAEAIISYN